MWDWFTRCSVLKRCKIGINPLSASPSIHTRTHTTNAYTHEVLREERKVTNKINVIARRNSEISNILYTKIPIHTHTHTRISNETISKETKKRREFLHFRFAFRFVYLKWKQNYKNRAYKSCTFKYTYFNFVFYGKLCTNLCIISEW